jgi:hypothetical protein
MIITLEAASYIITLISLLTLSGGGAFSVVFLQQQLLALLKEKSINICSGFDPVCTNDGESPPT